MLNTENIKELADVAYESENWQQASDYYSKLLENDLSEPGYWLRKGTCAAGLNGTDGNRVAEVRTLVNRATSMSIGDIEKSKAAKLLRAAYQSTSRKLDELLLTSIKDYQKVSMPQGGSALLHMTGQQINKSQAITSQAASRLKALELLEIECALNPTPQNYAHAINQMELLFSHSKKNNDYLKDSRLGEHVEKTLRFHTLAESAVKSAPFESAMATIASQPILSKEIPSVDAVAQPRSSFIGKILRVVGAYIAASVAVGIVLALIGREAKETDGIMIAVSVFFIFFLWLFFRSPKR